MKKSRVASTVATAVVLIAAVGCRPSAPGELHHMTFMAGFRPQANLPFVGAYVAKELGFFEDAGLDVSIEHSGGGGEHLQLLAQGEVEVTTQDAAVLLKRRAEPGLPLVSLALVGQRGQQTFVALADSGIATPAEWAGRTVGFKGTPPPDLYAILETAGLSESDVDLVNVGFDPRVLSEGKVDVYPVFKSNEPNIIRGWGYDLNVWDAADSGVPTLGLTYVSSEATIAEHPDMVRGFLRAVMEGIAWAAENRDEAVDVVLEYTGDGADRDHMRFMLDAEFVDAFSPVTDEFGLGWQTEEQWQALHDMLARYDAIPRQLDVSEAFTTEFLPQAQ